MTREELKKLPKGVFTAEDVVEEDGHWQYALKPTRTRKSMKTKAGLVPTGSSF